MTTNKIAVATKSKGNVFADLGVPDAGEHHVKSGIVAEIYKIVKSRRLTQVQAAEVMGITQPQVSRMFRGHFREYSVLRLINFLTVFDRDVDIVIRPHEKKRRARGQVTIQAM